MEYRLSDAYINEVTEPALELKVTVLNVNEGHNEELMKHCTTLKEYAQYVAKVRRYAADMGLEAAVKRAIDESIAEGILEDFLRKNRAEVEMTSIFEYNKEEEEKKLRRAEYDLGVEDGVKIGIGQGIEQGIERGIEQGMERGTALTMINDVEKIVRKNGQTVAEACDLLDYSMEQFAAAKKLVEES